MGNIIITRGLGGGYSSRSMTVRPIDRIYSWLAEMQMKLFRPIDEKWCHY